MKKKVKYISFLVAFFVVMSLVTTFKFQAATVAPSNAQEVVNQMGLGFNLGKVFAWRVGNNLQTAKQTIDKLKSTGFNTVRIPVIWKGHINPTTGQITDTQFLNELKDIVKYAVDKNLYVIINTQEDVGFSENSLWDLSDVKTNAFKVAFTELWTELAQAFPYNTYDYHLIFEACNEPKNYKSETEKLYPEYVGKSRNSYLYDEWTFPGRVGNLDFVESLNNLFASIMQKVAPQRYYMITSYNGNSIASVGEYTSKINPNDVHRADGENYLHMPTVNKNKAIMTVHMYTDITYAKDVINALKTNKVDIPIYIGETGTKTDEIAKNKQYIENLVDIAHKNGINVALWDDSQSMSLINRNTLTWYDEGFINNLVRLSGDKPQDNSSTEVKPLTISSFTTDKASPQIKGTKITLTAKATGTGALQYRFRVGDGKGNYSIIKGYSTSNTAVWNANYSGNKILCVDVKDGNGKETTKTMNYVINEKTVSLAISSFTANKTSPQAVNASVTFTTKVSGVTGTAQYKYYRYLNGQYALIKDWSTNSSMTIAPGTAGTYEIYVGVKDDSGNIVRKNIVFEFKNQTNLSVSSFTADKASPQIKGTKITLTAKATGTGALQYRFRVGTANGNSSLIKDYSTSNTATWSANYPGTKILYVDVKDSTGKVITKTMPYVINEETNGTNYTKLEYVENNTPGYYFLDPSVEINEKSTVEIKTCLPKASYGDLIKTDNLAFRVESNSGVFGRYSWYNSKVADTTTNVLTIKQSGKKTYVNNNLVRNITNNIKFSNKSMKIGNAVCRIYYVNVYNESGKLIRNYIPVLDSAKQPCLYDTVTKSFFYFNGTGLNYK